MPKDKSKKKGKLKDRVKLKNRCKSSRKTAKTALALREMLIREVAYSKAIERKFQCTCCERDWLEAEREVDEFLHD